MVLGGVGIKVVAASGGSSVVARGYQQRLAEDEAANAQAFQCSDRIGKSAW